MLSLPYTVKDLPLGAIEAIKYLPNAGYVNGVPTN